MFGDTPLVVVDTPEALRAAVNRLLVAPVIGVDTESDGFHRYREKVCLIQISDMDQDYIIDRLALPDLTPLAPLFEDPERVKIFHGADYDIVSLRRDFGFNIQNLFDTMIAAQFLGLPRVGLADLIERWFGFRVDKTLQRHDWSARPLLSAHLEYARGDTHFLLALREVLTVRLVRAGRLSSVQEECALIAQRQWQGRQRDPADFLRMKGARQLDDPGLRVLRALHAYRDAEAEAMDRPPFKVIPDPVLLDLAATRPTTWDDLAARLRRGSSLVRRHGDGLVEAVRAGLADERPLPEEAPRPVHAPSPRISGRAGEALLARLKDWRNHKINVQGEAPATVISNTIIKNITRIGPRTLDELAGVPEIRAWQVERFGPELVELVNQVVGDAPGEPGGGKKRRRRRRGKVDEAE